MNSVSFTVDCSEQVINRIKDGEKFIIHSNFEFKDEKSQKHISQNQDHGHVGLFLETLSSLYPLVANKPYRLFTPTGIVVETREDSQLFEPGHVTLLRAEDDTVTVTVVDAEGIPVEYRGTEIPWDPSSFITSVEVSVQDYIRTVIEESETYIELLENHWPGNWKSELEPMALLLESGKDILSYVEANGSIEGYHMDVESELVQSYLYDSDYIVKRLSWFLAETGVVAEEVDRLRAKSDDEAVEEAYGTLLSHPSVKINRAVAQALAEDPDIRAKKWLLGQLWSDDPKVMPAAIRAASEWNTPDVAEDLCEILDYSNHANTRTMAAEALGDFEGEDVIDTLETAAQEDDSEAVREAARQSLETIQQ